MTTFSDHARLERDGPPYAEHMFTADGEIVLKKLEKHISDRKYGKWVSVATSEKCSYRIEDVLIFWISTCRSCGRMREDNDALSWRMTTRHT